MDLNRTLILTKLPTNISSNLSKWERDTLILPMKIKLITLIDGTKIPVDPSLSMNLTYDYVSVYHILFTSKSFTLITKNIVSIELINVLVIHRSEKVIYGSGSYLHSELIMLAPIGVYSFIEIQCERNLKGEISTISPENNRKFKTIIYQFYEDKL